MLDSIIKKGAWHKFIPQDYVIAEDIGTAERPFPFIAVADGCSAGQHSEIGAMILCRAALAVIKEYSVLGNPPLQLQSMFLRDVTNRTRDVIQSLNLSLDDMIATLRVAYILDNILYVIGTGDGFHFFVQDTAGGIDYDEYEYEINAPFYLAYSIFNKIPEYDAIGPNHLIQTHVDLRDETASFVSTHPSHHFVLKEYPLSLYPDAMYFGLATDGLGTYMKTDGSNMYVSPRSIVERLVQIKIPSGEFLARRFQKMDKELTAQGFVNQDDIGIAVLSIFTYRETLKANQKAST